MVALSLETLLLSSHADKCVIVCTSICAVGLFARVLCVLRCNSLLIMHQFDTDCTVASRSCCEDSLSAEHVRKNITLFPRLFQNQCR